MTSIRSIIPCLWFDTQAEDAAKYYASIFPNSRIGRISHYTEAGREFHGREPGAVLTVSFTLNGQEFVALNGGPNFTFNEAVSFQIMCDTQQEVDHYWNRLGEGGDPSAQQCSWLKDKFGVSWQVVPRVLMELISDPDKGKAARALNAMMGMKKIDIAALKKAAGP